ncbi:hypothetical protein HGRIS_011709 [Hohenbuehelia grisea]|uniref:Uncharacterized protein n=1 Tax=Hohenbuehelia grisea TaxID=104357 RepID=A0ABR3JW36_9AGAR
MQMAVRNVTIFAITGLVRMAHGAYKEFTSDDKNSQGAGASKHTTLLPEYLPNLSPTELDNELLAEIGGPSAHVEPEDDERTYSVQQSHHSLELGTDHDRGLSLTPVLEGTNNASLGGTLDAMSCTSNEETGILRPRRRDNALLRLRQRRVLEWVSTLPPDDLYSLEPLESGSEENLSTAATVDSGMEAISDIAPSFASTDHSNEQRQLAVISGMISNL